MAARKTISQRIALRGGDEIKKQLSEFGNAGERAFKDVQQAADKLTGPGAQFARNLDAARKKIQELGESMKNAGRQMRNVGAGMSAGITAPLALLGKQATDAWRTQEAAIKRVDAALKSTGGTVGLTSQQLQTMASGFQAVTTYGDEAILEMQAKLLTFTNITGAQFGEASKAVLNLSAAMGTDLKSSVLQIGKALNDPAKGLSALSRSGIQFSRAQEEMIKSMAAAGDVAGAQTIMLAELEKQFGGMAEALAQTDAGKWTQSMNLLGDALERVGQIIAPFIADLAGWISKMATMFMELPEGMQRTIVVVGAVAAALGPLLATLGLMVMGLGAAATGFATFMGAMAGIPALLAAVGTAMSTVVGIAAAFVSWPALLAAAIGALAVVIYKNWDEIVEYLKGVFAWLPEAAAEAWQAVRDKAEALWQALPEGLRNAVNGIRELISQVVDYIAGQLGWLESKISGFVDSIKSKIDAVKSALRSAVPESIRNAAEVGTGILSRFAGGGDVRGPGTGTSDSILARLSNGEFVVRARAVKHYGADLFRRLNSMSFPSGGMPGFASGGLVSGMTVPIASAPAERSDAMRPVNLSIGGESFGGLMAPRETADRLIRFALREEAKSAGRRPGWYKGA